MVQIVVNDFFQIQTMMKMNFIIGTNSTGFDVKPSFYADNTSIAYIAILRPHKPITDPTKLFDLVQSWLSQPLDISLSVADMVFYKQLNSTHSNSINLIECVDEKDYGIYNLAETNDNNGLGL